MNVTGPVSYPLTDGLFALIGGLFDSAAAMARFLTYRSDLYRSRQELRDLSDEQLRDVGVSRRQAEAEAARPFFEN